MFVKHIQSSQYQHMVACGSNFQPYLVTQHITFNIFFLQVSVSSAGKKNHTESLVAHQRLGITVIWFVVSLVLHPVPEMSRQGEPVLCFMLSLYTIVLPSPMPTGRRKCLMSN